MVWLGRRQLLDQTEKQVSNDRLKDKNEGICTVQDLVPKDMVVATSIDSLKKY